MGQLPYSRDRLGIETLYVIKTPHRAGFLISISERPHLIQLRLTLA